MIYRKYHYIWSSYSSRTDFHSTLSINEDILSKYNIVMKN